MTPLTYRWIFNYLDQLGFEDRSVSEFERVFEHVERGILIAVSMLDDPHTDRIAREIDVTSIEFRLQQHCLLAVSLREAVEQSG